MSEPKRVIDDSPEWEDRPEFETDEVVSWNCPNCGEDGTDSPKTADYWPICNNRDCAVYVFSVFRGESE